MKMKHLLFAGAMLLGGLGSASANAQAITSRAALNALLGANQTLENFELFTNTSQISDTQTLNSTTNWASQGTGKVAAGVNYSAGSGNGAMFLNTDGYYGLSSHTLGDAFPGRALNMVYTAPVTAFGIDLQGYAGYDAGGIISVYDTMGTLLSATNVQGGYNGASSFFGWQNAGGIGRVVIAATNGNGYIMIDNHGFGTNAVAGVPEPATWAMMIFGFGFVGAAVRRERKVARVSYAV